MRYFKITSKFAGKHPDRRDDAYKDEESRVISAGDSYIAEKKKAYFACVTALTDKRCEAVFAGTVWTKSCIARLIPSGKNLS